MPKFIIYLSHMLGFVSLIQHVKNKVLKNFTRVLVQFFAPVGNQSWQMRVNYCKIGPCQVRKNESQIS